MKTRNTVLPAEDLRRISDLGPSTAAGYASNRLGEKTRTKALGT
jgi:hypothetical protein